MRTQRSANAFAWGAPRRNFENFDASGGEHGVKGGIELGVPVPDQETEPVGALVEVHKEVPGGLGNPGAGGVSGDAGQVHPATLQFDHEEHV